MPSVQVGITLMTLFAGALGGDQLSHALAEWLKTLETPFLQQHAEAISFNVVTISVGAISLIFGELVPKRLALRHAETYARIAAPVMNIVSIVARPAIWFLSRTSNAILYLLGMRDTQEPSVSIDDIEHLIQAGTVEGVVEAVEQRVAREALRLGERKVRDVMRPRIDLDALDIDTPPDEILGAVIMAGFSRLPVYEKDLDHIIGYVHIKDLFRQQYMGWPMDLRKLLRPALFVPETMPLDRLLQLFQEQHNQLAVVLDEFGGTEGMVTLEDVVQELVGEIRDEQVSDHKQRVIERAPGSWLIDGTLSVADFCEVLKEKQPSSDEMRGFSTISGLILTELGRIPRIGESITWRQYTIEVVDMDGQRIDRVMVNRGDAVS